MLDKYRVDDKKKAALDRFDPDDTGRFRNRADAEEAVAQFKEQLTEYQEKLFAGKKHGVLILFQGMDCSGKDGVVKKALAGLNPQGFRAESFKRPTEEEASHDFLWRAHKVVPAKGYIASFNRSYYEDVLVNRAHKRIDKREAASRLRHIRHFEELLTDNGIVIVKIFLHISKEFQLKKITERMENPEKLWKFDPSDLEERRYWDEYMTAHEEVFRATGTPDNPWHVVPANNRWFRDYATLAILASAFEKLKLEYPRAAVSLAGAVAETKSN